MVNLGGLIYKLIYYTVSYNFKLMIKIILGFKILTAVVMKIYFSWDITPCSPLQVNRLFGGTSLLHLQGQRVSEARNQLESGSKQNIVNMDNTQIPPGGPRA
jgi:hypothetical protein